MEQNGNESPNYVSLNLQTYKELYEKAKKYDEMQGECTPNFNIDCDDLPF